MGIGRGYGKILLFGEHAAVYGHPAIGLSLPLFTEVSIGEQNQEPDALLLSPAQKETVNRVIDQIADRLGLANEANESDYSISTNIPIGSGLGSSATLSAAVARALAEDYLDEYSPDLLWTAANEGEKLFHGTPSGIDTGLALFNSLIHFSSRQGELPGRELLEGSASARILVASAPRNGTTSKLVSTIRKRVETGDAAVKKTLENLGRYSSEAASLLSAANRFDAGAIGRLADLAHKTLSSLNLSTSSIDEFLAYGRMHGAAGGKLSGAGGGGACYLLFADSDSAGVAESKLKGIIEDKMIPVSLHGVFSLRPDNE